MRKTSSLTLRAFVLAVVAVPAVALASGSSDGHDIITLMARLVLQLGVIVMVARFIGMFIQKLNLPIPSVLIEVLAGVFIGPHLLGGMALPGFPDGLFPLASSGGIPVSPELYGIATIASIIMLFTAGLETDLALLLKFSFVGLIVGIGGVLLPFFAGSGVAVAFFNIDFFNPGVLFLGVMSTATSVGITARILSEKRKMDSPEGVTILAGAVIDDVLGIIALTVVTGIIAAEAAAAMGVGGAIEAGKSSHQAWTIGKAVLVWLGFTVAGITFAGPLSRFIKKFKSVTYISIFSLGLAFVLAGIFEMAGLAMIIGAYVVGLSLSKTDLTDTVRDALEVLQSFFVPVFFIVMGMLVDPRTFMYDADVLTFGLIYAAVAVLTKIIGCGVPTLLLNFNRLGALRIGVGMVPRGEVALIIAGIGLTAGIIDQKFFGAGVIMTLGTSLIAPPFLALLFRGNEKGTKKEFQVRQTVTTPIELDSRELTELLEIRVARAFRAEGFFVHSITIDAHNIYHIRKDDTLITLHCGETGIDFESDAKDVMFVNTIVYEALVEINSIITTVKDHVKPQSMLKDLADEARGLDTEFKRALSQGSIIPFLKAKTKPEIVCELVDILCANGLIKVKARDDALNAVMEREASMSTGMQFGIALPHARTDAVDKLTLSVGLSRKGVDYQALDGELSKIFVLILSPQSSESSHLKVLANISALLNCAETREKLLRCTTQEDIFNFFKAGLEN